ncbi:hypothetical protein H4R34_003092 [Dimargaris verticillata]|uniref:Uncharacterized protein n=1 Tax=Dimargaris verticillata TaxID=2761393 RepID=A0A9W8B7J4_9FUNG|nr:hypothetical protein H4R34_003092 [Dimargaris verticillata]
MDHITQWDVNKVYEWFCSLGFQAYERPIRENKITGDVLIHLHHDALNDLSISSLGKRLVILKAIYQLKVQYRIPLTSDDYIPPDIEGTGAPGLLASEDPAQTTNVLNQMENLLEEQELMITHLQREVSRLSREVVRVNGDLGRLKDDLRPVITPSTPGNTPASGRFALVDSKHLGASVKRPAPILTKMMGSPKASHPLNNSSASLASASYSGGTFMTSSNGNLSPMPSGGSGGMVYSAGNGGNGYAPISPSSPPPEYYNYKTHTYQDISLLRRSGSLTGGAAERSASIKAKRRSIEKLSTPPGTTPLDRSGVSVIRVFGGKDIHRENESYKTFRISADDPCHKILPSALKKYNINDDWRNYTLCIIYGSSERRLQLDEKPLKLFQQLQEANESPYFVLKSNKPASALGGRDELS